MTVAEASSQNSVALWQTEKIGAFLDSGASFRRLTIPHLSFVALRIGGETVVVSARLTFASPTAVLAEKDFESPTVKAMTRRLPNLATADALITSFAEGRFDFEGQKYSFPSDDGSEVRVEVEPFHQGAGSQTRLSVLTMRGRSTRGLSDSPHLDWEVKSATAPYLNFQEVLLDFGVPVPQGFGIFESFHALPIAIDGEQSQLQGTTASVSLKAERGIEPDEVNIGLIAVKAGEPAYRETIAGSALVWQDDGRFLIGSVERQVPPGRTVQAVASLRGVAFHFWWLFDPQHVVNPRKGIFELFDPDLSRLREFVSHPPRGAARELEAGVASLFWMLGFSVAHLDSGKFAQDAVDILVATPAGNFALVECTTGVISTDRKVPNLLRRRALVLEMLAKSNHNAVRVLPILVTSCTKEEVEQEIAPAQERGVLVLTRADLEEMLDQSSMLLDAEEVYKRAEEQVGSATTSPTIPGLD